MMLIKWLRHIVIILVVFNTSCIYALEYIEIDSGDNIKVSVAIEKADLLFQQYFRGEVEITSLKDVINQVKDKKYHNYFEFHYKYLSENNKYTLEELEQLGETGLDVMKITVGLYLEQNNKFHEAAIAFEKVDLELSKIYLARVLILQNIDAAKGINILKSLDINGNDLGNSILGAYYSKEKKFDLANTYLLKVENKNYPYALHNLAMNLYYGKGLEKDKNRAKSLFERAYHISNSAKSGIMLGMLALTEKKDEIALAFWLESLNNGNPNGAYLIGKYHLSHIKNRDDLDKANRFLVFAKDGGVLLAYYQLAKMKILQSNIFGKPELKKEAYDLAKKVNLLDQRVGKETFEMLNMITERQNKK